MRRQLAVVSAGLSTPSSTRLLANRLAADAVAELAERDIDASIQTFELRDVAHDVTDRLLTGRVTPALEELFAALNSADGLIAVTPIFSTSYSGLFKSFIDVLDPNALNGTPVLLGANAGSARHSLAVDYAMRPLFTYLHASPLPTGVFAASGDWDAQGEAVAPLADRIRRGARELAEAVAARPARVFQPADVRR